MLYKQHTTEFSSTTSVWKFMLAGFGAAAFLVLFAGDSNSLAAEHRQLVSGNAHEKAKAYFEAQNHYLHSSNKLTFVTKKKICGIRKFASLGLMKFTSKTTFQFRQTKGGDVLVHFVESDQFAKLTKIHSREVSGTGRPRITFEFENLEDGIIGRVCDRYIYLDDDGMVNRFVDALYRGKSNNVEFDHTVPEWKATDRYGDFYTLQFLRSEGKLQFKRTSENGDEVRYKDVHGFDFTNEIARENGEPLSVTVFDKKSDGRFGLGDDYCKIDLTDEINKQKWNLFAKSYNREMMTDIVLKCDRTSFTPELKF